MSTELTTVERKELATLETRIEKGVIAFVEVGSALKDIRDSKLYRESHKTFEKYVADRWSFKKTRAYELIASASVAENVRNSGQNGLANPGQATELAKAPPEQQAEIWQEVTEAKEKPTAKDVKEAVNKRNGSLKGEIVADEYEDVEDDDEESSMPFSDPVAKKARERFQDRMRGARLDLGNMGYGDTREHLIRALEESVGL